MFGVAGESLTLRLKHLIFQSLLKQVGLLYSSTETSDLPVSLETDRVIIVLLVRA